MFPVPLTHPTVGSLCPLMSSALGFSFHSVTISPYTPHITPLNIKWPHSGPIKITGLSDYQCSPPSNIPYSFLNPEWGAKVLPQHIQYINILSTLKNLISLNYPHPMETKHWCLPHPIWESLSMKTHLLCLTSLYISLFYFSSPRILFRSVIKSLICSTLTILFLKFLKEDKMLITWSKTVYQVNNLLLIKSLDLCFLGPDNIA